MQKNNQIIEAAKKYIEEIFKNDFSGHDYFHSIRVYNTAVKIADEEKADSLIVSLAALLHDVDDRKLSPQTYEKKDNAVKFLKSQSICESDIKTICKIIDEVSFNGTDTVVPSSIEGKCVQDADRLDAIGAIGIARAFAYGGNHNREIYNPDIPPALGMTKEQYKNHVSTSLNHFYEKLFLLKGMMNTNAAKKIAEKRDNFMKAYVDEFLFEWNGQN